MTSTSSDRVVARDLPADTLAPAATADLRTGAWTRLGSGGVLGDAVTEATLGGLAERSHAAARAQGYATGWAEGRRFALTRAAEDSEAVRRSAELDRARRDAEHRQGLAALDTAVARLEERTAAVLDELAGHTVATALALTEAILGRELATATDPGADALRRAMALVDPTADVTVRLHPADREALDPAALDGLEDGRRVALVADPSVQRGDAVAETADTHVDATVAAALARVREVLSR